MIKFPTISLRTICKALNVNRSSTYYTKSKALISRDSLLAQQIQTIRLDHPHYGLRRLKMELDERLDEGLELDEEVVGVVGINRIRRICRTHNLLLDKKSKKLKKRDIGLDPSTIPNLVKELQTEQKILKPNGVTTTVLNTNITKPNQVWSSDFTYFNYYGIWYYLATVIDTYSKEITGFALSTNHSTKLIQTALINGINKYNTTPEIAHSDQGSEYTSEEYQNTLRHYNIKPSNSAKSSPWEVKKWRSGSPRLEPRHDNGYQESFYGKFKLELEFHLLPYQATYADIYNYIANQIDYYNNHRFHTSIKDKPVRFRQRYYQRNRDTQEENLLLEKVGP